jgi:hypothetical protein
LRHPLISLSLVLLLLSPAALSWLATAWQKHAVKEAVEAQLREGMEASELVVLAFAKSEAGQLEWEHEREFEYRGQMYDLVKTEQRNDSLFYTCYWDHAETELHHQLDRWAADWLQQSPLQQQQSERLTCFFRSLYCMAVPMAPLPISAAVSPFFDYYHQPCGILHGPPPLPPPERVKPTI